jgi:hypothetical protein
MSVTSGAQGLRNSPAAWNSAGTINSGASFIAGSMNASEPLMPFAYFAKFEIIAAFSGSMMKFRNNLALSGFFASLSMAALSMKKGKPSLG